MNPIGWIRWHWYLWCARRAARARFEAFKRTRRD